MISKLVKGSHSGSVVRYLINPAKSKDARIIASNIKGDAIDQAVRDFEPVSELNYKQIKDEVDEARSIITTYTKNYANTVTHIAVGFDPKDGEVSKRTKKQVAIDLLDRLGYKLTPYLVVEHQRHDPEHPIPLDHDHIHIWTVPININGKPVNTRHDYYRSHQAMREIEKDLGLEPFLYHNQKRELNHVQNIHVIPQLEVINHAYDRELPSERDQSYSR